MKRENFNSNFTSSLLVFCVAIVLSSCNSGNRTKIATENRDTLASKPTSANEKYVKLVIEYKKDSSAVIDSIPVTKDKFSVEDAMVFARDVRKTLAFKEASGFLNSINGVNGEGAKKMWWLCVNDSSSMVSYKDRAVAGNDKIVWHYLVDSQDGCKVCYCQSAK